MFSLPKLENDNKYTRIYKKIGTGHLFTPLHMLSSRRCTICGEIKKENSQINRSPGLGLMPKHIYRLAARSAAPSMLLLRLAAISLSHTHTHLQY